MFKRVLLLFLFLFLVQTGVLADDISDVKAFFNSYVNAANSYSTKLPNFYLSNARIIRVVHKKDGTKKAVPFPMSAYLDQMKKGAGLAKMTGYKNNYKDIKVAKLGKDYKVSALRYPNKDKVGMPFHFIVIKTSSGYKIKEESMDTNVQDFLKYAK